MQLARILPTLAVLLLLPAGASAQPLRPGDQGERVRSLNERLITLGYLPQGKAGTSYDPATFHAVMAVQKWNGLTRDGVAGPRTRKALRDAARPSAARPGRRVEVRLDRQVALLIDRAGKVLEGSEVPAYAASHGCVRVPKPFAAEVYAFASRDTRVRVV